MSKTIRSLIDAFVAVAKEENLPLYYNNEYGGVDPNIFKWLPDAQVVEEELQKGTIAILEEVTTEDKMEQTALKLPLSQAIEYMTVNLKMGYFYKELRSLIIYLIDTKDGVPLELCCHVFGDELYLYLKEVEPNNTRSTRGLIETGFLRKIV